MKYKCYLDLEYTNNNITKAFYKLEYNGFNIIIRERIVCNYQNDIEHYLYIRPLYFNKLRCTAVSVLKWYRILRKTIIYNKINETQIHLL